MAGDMTAQDAVTKRSLFKQVRTMLHSRPSQDTNTAFQAARDPSPSLPRHHKQLPIVIPLDEGDRRPIPPSKDGSDSPRFSPSTSRTPLSATMTGNEQLRPAPHTIKRKPTPSQVAASQKENESTVGTGSQRSLTPEEPRLPKSMAPSNMPLQSILSRTRPVSRGNDSCQSGSSSRRPSLTKVKALPLPPELANASNSHLEHLEARAQDLAQQRRNVQKTISELAKVEKASPMEVDFATVRDAKKRLVDYQSRLDEVILEETEVGILISRARRSEEGNMWVRRVTG